MVDETGLDEGANFAEGEFMAGWIALQFLHDADAADEHFHRLAEGVSTPVSLSRGWYWTGRAREEQDDEEGAKAAYEAAAEHSSAYYGQLAAIKLDPNAAIAVPPRIQPSQAFAPRKSAWLKPVLDAIAPIKTNIGTTDRS